ncbi:cobalt-precorrin-6Y C(15)-methyltransferase [Sporanaerobium hydrogeniformans]|uniref:Cobalt-precorrin-6Y C(15)-methyltransferase n=1 Tax=Sporanaerobium hydrogeniformans TaxID=3072179 RepID=A0AC61DDR1_9FIRM|nr:decarboxylating cobalt-precorrin-6B (C(15))-methyltransferase [Sporanaerobium hydrogeniformans]PHV70990.1 cobalt-precorrin-6Y C(15)-methyltransferase [Sporanaerobium hydrogeniformans]
MKNSAFITGQVPITKEEVRAISLNKLELKNKKSFLDIGAGTGTVGIEAAHTYHQLTVWAVEQNPKAIEVIKKNVDKFKLSNYNLIEGTAPMPFRGTVDAIFVGGSSGKLEEIMKWSYELLTPGGHLVTNFLLIENFYEALGILKQIGFKNVEATLLSVCKLEKLGQGEYFKPFNPIYILSGQKEEGCYE